jgi:hypothetical protein
LAQEPSKPNQRTLSFVAENIVVSGSETAAIVICKIRKAAVLHRQFCPIQLSQPDKIVPKQGKQKNCVFQLSHCGNTPK